MEITAKNLKSAFEEKIVELSEESEFQWGSKKINYAVDQNGEPDVKLALGNVPLDYDLWEGLRNPALIGLHPAGLKEIWEFYANKKKDRIDESGRPTIFQIPRSFGFALKNYKRAVIISFMLPFSQQIIDDYVKIFQEKNGGSSHLFSRMYEYVNSILDKATSRMALDLVSKDRVVVAMDNATVNSLSQEALPITRQGDSHGPSKGGNYPQKSVAVLMGLGQLCVNRIVYRDEIADGEVQRFAGPIRSIIVFDKEKLVKDGKDGIIYPTKIWREFLFKMFDFTNTDPDLNKYRFCTYIPFNDEGCRKCISFCPSGAQANSTPTNKGNYSENILKQSHRFWEDELQFDYDRCCDDRGQMATIFPEWSCARCVTICAAEGKRRIFAAKNFYQKMLELTKD